MTSRPQRQGGAGSIPRTSQSDMLRAMGSARKSGMSPMQFVQQRIQKTPQAQQAMRMLSGDQNQLHSVAENLARQRGIDLDAFVRDVGSF